MDYPQARKDGTSETLHGVVIEDPYRHLEDSFAPETQAFVDEQNALTTPYLERFPHFPDLRRTLTSHTAYASVKAYTLAADGHAYWEVTSPILPQPVIRRARASALDLDAFTGDEGEVFFDVNALTNDVDGTASQSWGSFSPGGKYWAGTISRGGSDWQTVMIVDLATKERVDEELRDVKFCWAICWLGDEGFIYKRAPPKHKDDTSAEGNFASTVHYIGTPQSDDFPIWSDPASPQSSVLIPRVSDDDRFLVMDIFRSTEPVMMLLVAALPPAGTRLQRDGPLEWIEQSTPWDGTYKYLTTTSAGVSVFLTNRDSSPRSKISVCTLGCPELGWRDIIPSHPKGVLVQADSIGGGLLLIVFSLDVGHQVWIYTDEGVPVRRVSDVEVPYGGMIKAFGCGKDQSEFSIESWSYISPPTVYRGVVNDGDVAFSVIHTASVEGWSASDYVQNQVFYPSLDGTLIPMHISHHRSISLSSTSSTPPPILLFAYGGFAWAQEPKWDPLFSTFMLMGGVVAVAGIRGGNEYGIDWHSAAIKANRQKGYDDVIEAARWLKKESGGKAKVAVFGSSNGGLMCSAVLNQAPELFTAALPDVGVHDLLRFHKFTMGALWTAEYGDPDDPADFASIVKISPLHNVTSTPDYPASFFTTAEHDSRVIPGHTLKMVAILQERKRDNPAPILCRVYKDTGHGMGKTTDQLVEENGEKLAFLALAMGIEWGA